MQSSMDSLISGLTIQPAQTSPEPPQEPEPQVQESKGKKRGAKPKENKIVRDTFLARFDPVVLDKARKIAMMNGFKVTEVINFAVEEFITKYEKKHGEIILTTSKTPKDLLK